MLCTIFVKGLLAAIVMPLNSSGWIGWKNDSISSTVLSLPLPFTMQRYGLEMSQFNTKFSVLYCTNFFCSAVSIGPLYHFRLSKSLGLVWFHVLSLLRWFVFNPASYGSCSSTSAPTCSSTCSLSSRCLLLGPASCCTVLVALAFCLAFCYCFPPLLLCTVPVTLPFLPYFLVVVV